MKKLFTKEVYIAIVTLIGLVILYVGLNHLKGINVFKPANHYYVSMPNVSELQISSPVYVDGFKVGIVNAILFDYDRPGNILVQISLDRSMRLQIGSYAELKSGLTSGAFLNLKPNTYASTYLAIGDTIVGQSQAGFMEQLSAVLWPQMESLLPHLDSILSGIQVLINHPALGQSLSHIETTTLELQKSSEQLNTLLTKEVPVILSNLNKVSSDMSILSGNLKEVDIQRTVATLDQTVGNINKITQQLNDSTNSLGLLLNDRALYQHLDSTAQNASNLLLDLRQNPKKYVHFSIF
jgi:phospholipid/cholesterol/gamma-HCH transport system substrate-binding protein